MEREWPIWRCRHCTHIYVSPQPSEKWLASYYRDFYMPQVNDESWYEQSRQQVYFVVAQAVTRYHGGVGKLLDIGSSYGGLLVNADALGWHTTGIDPNGNALHIAERRLQGRANLIHGMFDQSMLSINSFDCITMINVIEHVHDPLAYCRQAFDLLRPGGCLALRCPPQRSFFPLWVRQRLLNGSVIDAPEHLHEFTQRSFITLMRSAGFEQLRYAWSGLGEYKKRSMQRMGSLVELFGPLVVASSFGHIPPPFAPKLLLGKKPIS